MLKAQFTIFLIFSLLVGFIFYAKTTEIEISTKVQGEIIPFGNIRKVQNLEGGIIKKIYVKEGAKVDEGDVLLDTYNDYYNEQEEDRNNQMMGY